MKVNGYLIEPWADMRGVKLYGASLDGADLRGAYMDCTDDT